MKEWDEILLNTVTQQRDELLRYLREANGYVKQSNVSGCHIVSEDIERVLHKYKNINVSKSAWVLS